MNTIENISIRPVWLKSKEAIWNELFEDRTRFAGGRYDSRLRGNDLRRRLTLWCYAAAGILIPLLLVCHFYTVTTETTRGEQTTALLPDGSKVTLNVDGSISYKPLEWFVSRKVKLEGEAFFEVKHGSRFCVQSGSNRVYVLGTTFNVYARDEMYRVACLSGKVSVQAGGASAVLSPNMQATFRKGKLNIDNGIAPNVANGWMQGLFVFVETPLPEVIAEVERRYNITVTSDYNPDRLYSGTFAKKEHAEEVLAIIGKALNVTFSIK